MGRLIQWEAFIHLTRYLTGGDLEMEGSRDDILFWLHIKINIPTIMFACIAGNKSLFTLLFVMFALSVFQLFSFLCTNGSFNVHSEY